MRVQISRQPDGSFRGTPGVYRLHQSGDHFDVVRASDGASVGGFNLAGRTAEPDPELAEPEVVRAIADLMSVPRGLLPLQ